jgi:hypothetical protein
MLMSPSMRIGLAWGLFLVVPLAVAEAETVIVHAERAWTDTGIDVKKGQPLHLESEGRAWVVRDRVWRWFTGIRVERSVGPGGTYLWPWPYRSGARHPAGRAFPLPTMADGPFPAFGLIGRIGDEGEPFYVGASYDGVAEARGRLWLGINDDDLEDNAGQFTVHVELAPRPPRAARPAPLLTAPRTGSPLPKARVLLLYIDGLRPDVLQGMAEQGFLPHLREMFLERGLAVPHAFSVFPSNTLIANGSLFTGLFPDRTGIKSQNQFERSTLKPKGQLSAWLPDGFIPTPKTRVLNLLDKYAPENTHAFLARRGIQTLATRLGKAYRFTTLPIAPLNPPPGWLHRAINTIGPLNLSANLSARLDEVNAEYAIQELIGDPDARVIAVWFPMADKTCHHSRHGQFGLARRDLVLADHAIGRILARMRQVRWDRSTYAILMSDHGHLGGGASVNPAQQGGVNRSCNLPRDWAHRVLGCNARVVGQEWTHPGIPADRFLFFDNQGAGQAKLFLPHGSYFHGPWQRNRLYDLTHYVLRPGEPPVNLLESLAAFRPPGWDGEGRRPVDLILVKLDAHRVFVYRDDDRQAILHRLEQASSADAYRYEPVRHLAQTADGEVRYDPADARHDPLGYLEDPAFLEATGGPEWLARAHTAEEWLRATARTRYPDAVVAMSKFFAWKPPVQDLAEVRDPDLLVTASEGWSFRSDDGEGTDHGYPLADSMRMSLFLAGPNIAPGTLPTPHRIVDLLPTILEMVGWPYDPNELDGQAIRGIYE